MPDAAPTPDVGESPAPIGTDAENSALASPEGQQAHLAGVLKAMEERRGGDETPEKAAKTEKPSKPDDGDTERDEKGHFKPKDKTKEGEKAAKPAKPEGDASPGALARARRLWTEGKVDEFSQLVFGKPIDQVDLSGSGWKNVRKVMAEERREVSEIREQTEARANEIRQAATTLVPFAIAKAALERRDFIGFLAPFGMTPDTFQRALIQQAHGKEAVSEPAQREIAALRKELADDRAARKQLEDEKKARDAEAQVQANITTHMGKISQALADHEDPRVRGLAVRAKFLDAVYSEQDDVWDARTRTTIPIDEAIDRAIDSMYGGYDGLPSVGQAAKPGQTQRRGTEPEYPAARDRAEGGRKPTNLRPSQAAEAMPVIDEVNADFDDAEKQQERQARIVARLERMSANGVIPQ